MASPALVALPTDRKQIGMHPFLAVGEKYVRAVINGAGCLPVLLPTLVPSLPLREWLAGVDGIVLTGSVSNIEPHHYGDEVSYEGNLHDPARDATTLPLVRLALELELPLLALCRGFQEVNVALGGTLYQKVQEQPGMLDHREDTSAPLEQQYGPAHVVDLAAGGLLAGLAGVSQVRVNSLHGQGVRTLGDGLLIEATAADGLVEAFRHVGPGYLLGVQWHPEWRVTENPFYLSIFQSFGQACREHASRRQQRAVP
ncbi:gamma-glutamyl-gamma-aminobutyrate hydrolase family protein [Pseudoxanthomonas dokdonensis]|uniref:gamma-glutamyl-gamma-aminobutyrate hydrolase n=1 Tax=Pseudoxanthomonas dokdonensis TaxID=344882 RepID=A0A0R0CWR7_9GAMM|nr:gamma-glutamyl-gamma-aminobutyrate hydrolase family protein [Pseudoxanthomonas dokdonensis]KRG69795.1 glutamine amidotransferase [Pseudoxanthomonas dokdonensis]